MRFVAMMAAACALFVGGQAGAVVVLDFGTTGRFYDQTEIADGVTGTANMPGVASAFGGSLFLQAIGDGGGGIAYLSFVKTYQAIVADVSASTETKACIENKCITGGSSRIKIVDKSGGLSGASFAAFPAFDNDDAFAVFSNVRLLAVPEPSTWAFMIFGFGAVGAALRRKGARHHTTGIEKAVSR
jgi:hypothetical protein